MRLAVLATLVVLLSGCARAGSVRAGSGVPPQTPPYPHDHAVLQIFTQGGPVSNPRLGDVVPEVTVWGDGKVIMTTADGAVRQAQLTESTVDRLMAAAGVLYALKDYYQLDLATDLPGRYFSIETNAGRRTVVVYGVNLDAGRPGEPDHADVEKLRALRRNVLASLPADAAEFRPTRCKCWCCLLWRPNRQSGNGRRNWWDDFRETRPPGHWSWVALV